MSYVFVKQFYSSKDPSVVAEAFKDRKHLFLLESSFYDSYRGRYSFLGFNPVDCVECCGKDSLKHVREMFHQYRIHADVEVSPFFSGCVGFISYEYGLHKENIIPRGESLIDFPDVWFGFYETIVTFDHVKNYVYVTSIKSQNSVNAIVDKIQGLKESPVCSFNKKINMSYLWKNSFTKPSYVNLVKKIQGFIEQGDIYQVNLSQQFVLDIKNRGVGGFNLYDVLKQKSPSPFGAYLDCGSFKIISSSPERFLVWDNNVLQTRPMKGTASRGKSYDDDLRVRQSFLRSEKEKAELLMITDLLRNDLGKVCQYGTIHVKNQREIEEYKTVYQTTSTVEGVVREDMDCFDVLEKMLPGGSITGCPKIRAMKIINTFETMRRGIYTGNLGYINCSGNIDFNILIRTLCLNDSYVIYNVGGGIVYDSDAIKEYEETLIKSQAMKEAIEEVLS